MASLTPRPGILDITPYFGGKSSIDGFPADRIVKLASNESALGPSPRAVAAHHEAVNHLARYPDGGATALRETLANHHDLDVRRIVCGNGSDELIGLLARAYAGGGDEVLMSRYGFLVYPIVARAVGARPVMAPEIDLTADVDALLARVTPRTRIVFLANPNNPTGSYLSRSALGRLHAGLPGDVLLVVDAAYAEYVGAADYESGRGLVDDFDNVVMTRTFSKIHGLAGLRLGWAYCSLAVAEILNRLRAPFNVNAPALAAGVAALGDVAHTRASRRHNETFRPWLEAALGDLGLQVYPSVANFVLVRFPPNSGRDAETANAFLTGKGIIPRTLGNYGLPECLRITVGTEPDLRALVTALAEFMG